MAAVWTGILQAAAAGWAVSKGRFYRMSALRAFKVAVAGSDDQIDDQTDKNGHKGSEERPAERIHISRLGIPVYVKADERMISSRQTVPARINGKLDSVGLK